MKGKAAASVFADTGADADSFAIAAAADVAQLGLSDGEPIPAGFNQCVITAQVPHVLTAPFFKVDQIVGMMNHAHGISFCVAHGKFGFSDLISLAVTYGRIHEKTLRR